MHPRHFCSAAARIQYSHSSSFNLKVKDGAVNSTVCLKHEAQLKSVLILVGGSFNNIITSGGGKGAILSFCANLIRPTTNSAESATGRS